MKKQKNYLNLSKYLQDEKPIDLLLLKNQNLDSGTIFDLIIKSSYIEVKN